MSGSTIGGVIGGVVGFFFGVPQLGYALGSIIGGAIDPEEFRGPSIGDAQRQTSQAGAPRPVVYGHPAPFMGNIIDGEPIARKIEQTEGGKGGPEVTTERFILTSAIRICEGPIGGILKIWRNDQIVYDVTADGNFPDWGNSTPEERAAYIAAVRAKTLAFKGNIALYIGDETQLPDPTLEAIHGVGNTPYYRGTAYMVVKDDDVTDMRGSAAQWKFEVLQEATETSIVHVVPNDPVPGNSGLLGGVTGDIDIDPRPVQDFPGPVVAPLTQLTMHINPAWTSSSQAYAPNAGQHLIGGGYGPVRGVLVDQNGSILFDSGWMGYPIQQTDLDIVLLSSGQPPATIVSSPQVMNLQTPPGTTSLTLICYRTTFNSGIPEAIVADLFLEVDFPDPTLLPASYRITPEIPNALLGSDGQIYYPEWITPQDVSTLTPGDVFLGPVIADIASRCNVPAANLDVSALATDLIPGMLVAQQGPGADCIRPTQQAFFYDLPEYDQKLRAIKRGASTVRDITDAFLLDIDTRDELERPQAVEFPRLVSVVTQDPTANYAPVPQSVMRTSPDVKPTGEVTLSLAIPFSSDPSKQIAEKLIKVLWAQAEGRVDLPLPEEYSTLVASDCITYAGRRWLIEQTDYAEGEMRVRAVYDRASAYDSSASGQPAPAPSLPNSGLGGPTLLEWLNIPILSDLDDRLGFYVAVSGVTDGWRGATIQARANSLDPWTTLATVNNASVMGSLVTALPDSVSHVIDNDNTVRVSVNGQLSSITFEQLLNEDNACVIGDEICQFQTATFVSDGVYDLSILTRGRLETDPVTHAIGSRFALLNAPVFCEVPSSWIGRTLDLRAVTIGTVSDNNPSIQVVFSPARSQTEWVPVQFAGTRDTSNNIVISWVGQGRRGSNMNASNSQFFQHYMVTITKGSSSVVYTTINQTFPYSASQQTIDFGSATGTLTLSISAVNLLTGAGPALTGSIP